MTPIVVAPTHGSVTTRVAPRLADGFPLLPANSYVLLTLSGRVELVSGPWWPGPPQLKETYTAAETQLATGRATTHLFLGGPVGEAFTWPAPNGEDLIVLVRIGSTPAELWYSRDPGGYIKTVTSGYCIDKIWCAPSETVLEPTPWWERVNIEVYHVQRANTITATQIFEPLRVDAPAVIVTGTSATFTASTWGDLRLREPSRDTADVIWTWYAGDTAAVPNTLLSGEVIQECRGRTCNYAPGRSGRMRARTYVESAPVDVRSEVVRVVPFTVSMNCTPTVTRAASVKCEATWAHQVDSSQIAFNWRYEGDSVAVFPHPSARKFEPPQAIDSAGQGMRTWSGPAVLGGRVIVHASYGGVVTHDTSLFSVTPRGGGTFGDLPVEFDAEIHNIPTDSTLPLFNQHGSGTTFGRNFDTRTGEATPAQLIHGGYAFDQVSSGPNRGLWYMHQPLVRSTRGMAILTWLTGREVPKFDYTLAPGTLLTNRGLLAARRTGPNDIMPAHPDSTAFLLGVVAHESYGMASGRGHQGQFELAATSLETCGRVPAILEGVVAQDATSALRIAEIVRIEGIKSLAAAGDHDRVHSNFSNAPVYETVSSVTFADHLPWIVLPEGDAPKSAAPAFAPHPDYRCTRAY
ncbi:MAG TPA: hypothetical protein VHG93_21495 [Longimicrobium sp.]|nr:hypothetical protein [Longimicrobium sp.]